MDNPTLLYVMQISGLRWGGGGGQSDVKHKFYRLQQHCFFKRVIEGKLSFTLKIVV